MLSLQDNRTIVLSPKPEYSYPRISRLSWTPIQEYFDTKSCLEVSRQKQKKLGRIPLLLDSELPPPAFIQSMSQCVLEFQALSEVLKLNLARSSRCRHFEPIHDKEASHDFEASHDVREHSTFEKWACF